MNLLEPPVWARPGLSLAEYVFESVVRLRNHAYDRGWLQVHRVPGPVISVGNLAVGGIGKTPFVAWLVERISKRVAIVSRGYGGQARGTLPVDAQTSARLAGDEPVWLARNTGAMVVVDRDRVRGARYAFDSGAQVVVLDDGFQHRRLHRDLDLVLVDAAAPLANGHLLPRGPLREGAAALRRAHQVIGIGPGPGPVRMEVEVAGLGPLGHKGPVERLRGAKVALLAGIGRPERFLRTVQELGAQVVLTRWFPDHAMVSVAEQRRFLLDAGKLDALPLTTEKDAVRLGLDWQVLAIRQRCVAGETSLLEAIGRVLGAC